MSKQVISGSSRLDILDGVDLGVRRGESLAIVGASGAGKSTLLALLAGLDLPSSGEVLLDGVSLSGMDEDARAQLRAGRVGFVFQAFQLLSGLTALENVMLSPELAGLDQARLSHYPYQLSGGEQQRVAIARAFAGAPTILFADEPTGNLDMDTGAQIIELLFQMNARQGTTLVLVTHDAALAARCSQRLRLSNKRLQALDGAAR